MRDRKSCGVPKRFSTSAAGALAVAVVALVAVGDVLLAGDQGHQHQPGQITPTAKKMNEDFGANSTSTAEGLESEGRALFDRRFDVLDVLALKPGRDVADIGAGSGLFTRLIAERVGPKGTVYGVEISASLVNHIATTAAAMGLGNVKAVLGTPTSPRLGERSVDLAFVADSYHHFEHPREMLNEIKRALRPDGVLLIIDWERIEGVSHPFILDMVRAGKGTVTDEINDAGFELVQEVRLFDDEYVLKFRHRTATPGGPQSPGR
ncbi:MAG: methyltransferase domain-containing protein [Luteitalea sp.]|nr:methyltransferase domain-containing protein [Luteitalea sp.]